MFKFGESGQSQYTKKPTYFSTGKGTGNNTKTGGRSEDNIEDKHTNKHYANTFVWRGMDGSVISYDTTQGEEMLEIAHASGTGIKIAPDGSMDMTVTGNGRSYTKGSQTSTTHGNSDSKTEGHERKSVSGGTHSETQGDSSSFVGGSSATMVGGSMSTHTKGMNTMSGEQGVGMGVGTNTTQHSQFRMFADGSMRFQTQPQGDSGGAAVIDVDKEGNIKITSAKTLQIDTAEEMTIKAKALKIDAPVSINPSDSSQALEMSGNFQHTGNYTQVGNYNQDGIHVDSNGPHTA